VVVSVVISKVSYSVLLYSVLSGLVETLFGTK
jgi:hypothetical protein